MIEGESGSGKTASLRNLDPATVGIFNVAGKPLPFRKKFSNKVDNATYIQIYKSLAKSSMKRYVIDDSQYLMAFYMFDKVKETGYGKFTECAKAFYDLVQYVIRQTPPDCIVYFLHHVERTEDGHIKAKTSGKMLDSQLTLEGMFSIVLLCQADEQSHKFITQNTGFTTAKSPMDMFPLEIDNDLNMVDETIREYYEMNVEEKKNVEQAQ